MKSISLQGTAASAALLSWLDQSAGDAIYVIADDQPRYCNRTFREVFSPHESVLAELAARARPKPGVAAGPSMPRLPSQLLRPPSGRDAEAPLFAQEWWVEAESGPVVVGCVATARRAPETERVLWRVALHDGLTDLPGRNLFEDRLAQAIIRARRSDKFAALLYLDLDGFKPVNDQHGHPAGDIVLQVVSGRMLACVRETDTVARLGGDEFAIALDEVHEVANAEHIAAELIAAIAEPIHLPAGGQVRVGCSIGISLAPTNGETVRALLYAADQAMYAAKRGGGGMYALSAASPDDLADEKWMEDAEAENLGVVEIDAQHKALVTLANRLYHAIGTARDYAVQASLLDELMSFTQYHFSCEEKLMDRYGDPTAEAHKHQHAQLIGQVQFFRHALTQGSGQVVLSALRPWLIRHIGTFDRALAAFVATAKTRERTRAVESVAGDAQA